MATTTDNEPASMARPDEVNSFDVIIIGAGISGINAAYRIQTEGPAGTSYVILEGRDTLGGTWDLFRYPGIRSDSDMYTFGFPWNPWKDHKRVMACGAEIKEYMTQSAQSYGIDDHILYQHHVTTADWSSPTSLWTLHISTPSGPVTFTSKYLLLGTGYYDYTTPFASPIPNLSAFKGDIIHPQFWPPSYDHTDKAITIIGSGATAITLLPALVSSGAKSVTMLQRSPSYIFSVPSTNPHSFWTSLPTIHRLIWLCQSTFRVFLMRAFPNWAKRTIKSATVAQLPGDIPWDPHFNPRYNPWEQRFCACPDGDFYAALRSGKANVVTGTIKSVGEKGVEMEDGTVVESDAIVTATGLRLKFAGGIETRVDGEVVNWGERFAWRAAMVEGVPNLLFLSGYEDASWTLGADVVSRLFVRLLKKMEGEGKKAVVPRVSGGKEMEGKPFLSLSSTYLKNIGEVMPKGGEGVWRPKKNYFADMAGARWGSLDTDLVFS